MRQMNERLARTLALIRITVEKGP